MICVSENGVLIDGTIPAGRIECLGTVCVEGRNPIYIKSVTYLKLTYLSPNCSIWETGILSSAWAE